MPLEITTDDIGKAAVLLSTNPNAWIAAGSALYKPMAAPTPLSNHATNERENDLGKYTQMCALYQRILKKPVIPIHWQLQVGCPTHYLEISGSGDYFRSHADNLRVSGYSMKMSIGTTVDSIERLYESLSKRASTPFDFKWKKYRPDGYEAMFFADLVQWLTSDLPAASTTSQTTADILKDRINYCTAVHDDVFIFRDDTKINNPKARLQRIIKNLETLHKDISKSIEAASFNHYIDEIENNLLDMSTNAFSICHLILEGVNQRSLQVDEFLDPHPTDKKMTALTQLTMGQWIKTTLQSLGITSNNFQSGRHPIDLDAIPHHLNSDLSQILLNTTGLHEFIRNDKHKTRKENDAFSKNILLKIIDVHREILKLYYVKTSLLHEARVGVSLGESWLYGNEDGKLVVSALLTALNDVNNQFKKTMEDFWTEFFVNTYEPYAHREGMDDLNPTFRFLGTANQRFENIKTCHSIIDGRVADLAVKAINFADDAEVTKQTKQELINGLYSFLRRESGVDDNLLRGLERLSVRENSPLAARGASVITVSPLIIEPYIVRFPIARFPIYQNTMRLLVEKGMLEPKLTLMERPASFHTTMQKSIYDDILVSLHGVVNAGWLYSRFYSLTTFSMHDLRDFYSRVNTIMTNLYAPEALLRARTIIPVVTNPTQEKSGDAAEVPHDNVVDEDNVFFNLHKGAITPWTTELMMVDQHFKVALYHFSKKFRDNPMSRPLSANDYEILQIAVVGDNVEISLDKRLLTFAGGAFAIELEKYSQKLAQSEAEGVVLRREHAVLVARRNELLAESRRINEVIARQDEVIASKVEAIAQPEGQCPDDVAQASSSAVPASANLNAFFGLGDTIPPSVSIEQELRV